MASKKAALEELETRRREAAERLSELRRSLDRELGKLAPRKRLLAVPVVAFACGLAVALALRRKR